MGYYHRKAQTMRTKLLDGSQFYLYDQGEFISDVIWQTGDYFESASLRKWQSKYDTSAYVDIGANIGNHARFFSQKGSSVYAFEPSQQNYQILFLNCPSHHLYKVALSDTNGLAELVTYESCKGNNTISELWNQVPQWGAGIQTEQVIMARLDDFNIPRITFMKIDVEGSELRVLKGATNTLRIHRPVVAVEIHTDELLEKGNFEYRRKDIVNLMRCMDYKLMDCDAYGNHIFEPVDQASTSSIVVF